MKALVTFDCSVVAAFFIENDQTPYNEAALRWCDEGGAVLISALLWYELTNVFVKSVKRGSFAKHDIPIALGFMESFNVFPLPFSKNHLVDTADLAVKYNLTGYDASYLALAKQYNAPLATEDKMLKAAAQQEQLYWTPA